VWFVCCVFANRFLRRHTSLSLCMTTTTTTPTTTTRTTTTRTRTTPPPTKALRPNPPLCRAAANLVQSTAQWRLCNTTTTHTNTNTTTITITTPTLPRPHLQPPLAARHSPNANCTHHSLLLPPSPPLLPLPLRRTQSWWRVERWVIAPQPLPPTLTCQPPPPLRPPPPPLQPPPALWPPSPRLQRRCERVWWRLRRPSSNRCSFPPPLPLPLPLPLLR
jgi:hypothetical protein